MTATEAKPASTTDGAVAKRFCRRCLYDVSGLLMPECPECGSAFDPDDPRTTYASPSIWRRSAVLRYGPWIAALLLIATGFVHTILPRPRTLDNWRLWVWLGERYGVMEGPSNSQWTRWHIWAGRAYKVEAAALTTRIPLWDMQLRGDDRWTVRTYQPGLEWQPLLGSFTSMKSDLFGVRFEEPARKLTTKLLTITGSRVDVLSAFAEHFGMTMRSVRIREGQDYIWVYDAARGRMVTIDVTPENEEEHPLMPDQFGREVIPRDLDTTRPPAAPNPATFTR